MSNAGREQDGKSVLVEYHGDGDARWVMVTLNRPHRRNAVTGPMMDALSDAIDVASDDEEVAAVVLRGADGAFSSGVDLTELQAGHPWGATFRESLQRAHLALYRCRCPIVVALERYGINASAALAMAGDLVVAGEGSFVQVGEIAMGARIPMNAAWIRLKAGENILARMALMGDRIPAAEMRDLGLVHHVVPDDQVIAAASAQAARLAGYPAGSARQIKADIRARQQIDPETWFSGPPSPSLLSASQLRE